MARQSKSKSTNKTKKQKINSVIWVEIPVTNMERAKIFYTKVFGLTFEMMKMYEYELALFPMSANSVGAGGALVKGPTYQPSYDGPVIYFHSENIPATLKKVTQNSGHVIQNKKSIGDYGFVAYFEDTEGNRIALHSMK